MNERKVEIIEKKFLLLSYSVRGFPGAFWGVIPYSYLTHNVAENFMRIPNSNTKSTCTLLSQPTSHCSKIHQNHDSSSDSSKFLFTQFTAQILIHCKRKLRVLIGKQDENVCNLFYFWFLSNFVLKQIKFVNNFFFNQNCSEFKILRKKFW